MKRALLTTACAFAGAIAMAASCTAGAQAPPTIPATSAQVREKVVVPKLSGLTVTEAGQIAQRAGIRLQVDRVDRARGTGEARVIQQITPPIPGERVARGAMVHVIIRSFVRELRPPSPDTIEVPDVIGLSFDDAARALRDRGLVPRPARQLDTMVAAGTVVVQRPRPLSPVSAGSTVEVDVASRATTVPRLIGHTVADARELLDDRLLVLGDVASQVAPDPPGTIIWQEFAPTQRVAKGQRIAVRVAAALPEAVSVPSLLGLSLANARAVLAKSNLGIQAVGERDTVAPTGTVVAQDPPPDLRVPARSLVRVDTASDFVVMPRLVNFTPASAAARVSAYLLQLTPITFASDDSLPRRVERQSPDSGARVQKGSTVSVTLLRARVQQMTVPSVIGLDSAGAHAVLRAASLTLGRVTHMGAARSTSAIDVQSPVQNVVVAVNSFVSVNIPPVAVISPVPVNPPAPVVLDTATIPDVIGSTLRIARDRLRLRGFSNVIVADQRDGESDRSVVAQSPSGGDQPVSRTTPVTLTLAPPEAQTPTISVPNVLGLTADSAVRLLAASQLQADTQRNGAGPVEGIATSQLPGPGEIVAINSIVRVSIVPIRANPPPPSINVPPQVVGGPEGAPWSFLWWVGGGSATLVAIAASVYRWRRNGSRGGKEERKANERDSKSAPPLGAEPELSVSDARSSDDRDHPPLTIGLSGDIDLGDAEIVAGDQLSNPKRQ